MPWKNIFADTIYKNTSLKEATIVSFPNVEGNQLAIYAENPEARPNWTLALRLIVLAGLDNFPGDSSPAEFLRRMVPLRQNTLIELLGAPTSYDLKLEIPHWHQELSLQIWSNQQATGSNQYLEAETNSNVVKGQPLFVDQTGHLQLAQANQLLTAQAVVIAASDASSGTSCAYTDKETITLTDWTAIANQVELRPGATYYLSAEQPGQITGTAPTETGCVVVEVGTARSTQTLDVEIQPSIVL